MELVVAQNCPSCGAEIVLAEDSRMLRCPYCDVNNYRLERTAPRYLLPAKLPSFIPAEEVLFIPYLRFKGTVYEIRQGGVDHRLVDTTRIGIATSRIPASLGVRPQAMRLLPLTASSPGRYLHQTITGEEAFGEALAAADLLRPEGESPLYHRALIGETLSRIYQPCYFQGEQIYDAVLQRPLGMAGELIEQKVRAVPGDPSWEPRFISANCPQCGEVLAGKGDALVLYCLSCRNLWQERDGAFAFRPSAVVGAVNGSTLLLPFWRIEFATEGVEMRSFGEYLRFTNQPLRVGREHDSLPLAFFIPAFKLNPKAFLQLAAQVTLGQWRLPEVRDTFPENGYPVNLPAREAVQSLKTVVAKTTVAKKMRLPLLAKMKVIRPQSQLVYLAFTENGQDFIENHSRATVLAAALRHGRKL